MAIDACSWHVMNYRFEAFDVELHDSYNASGTDKCLQIHGLLLGVCHRCQDPFPDMASGLDV